MPNQVLLGITLFYHSLGFFEKSKGFLLNHLSSM